ncbi:MAG1430 family protein [Mycoplasma seminis]|uniref:Uncharacterized protein n=1 Tax=Mycoplasma seminis TaxID=512749 RepID=A0ABY9HA38_9MOLU|nr:hypothetical protein [Mycoplasma seminis]WLP85463.1 hypothetical protein Q8852_04040 [Mycoplasma seminis]
MKKNKWLLFTYTVVGGFALGGIIATSISVAKLKNKANELQQLSEYSLEKTAALDATQLASNKEKKGVLASIYATKPLQSISSKKWDSDAWNAELTIKELLTQENVKDAEFSKDFYLYNHGKPLEAIFNASEMKQIKYQSYANDFEGILYLKVTYPAIDKLLNFKMQEIKSKYEKMSQEEWKQKAEKLGISLTRTIKVETNTNNQSATTNETTTKQQVVNLSLDEIKAKVYEATRKQIKENGIVKVYSLGGFKKITEYNPYAANNVLTIGIKKDEILKDFKSLDEFKASYQKELADNLNSTLKLRSKNLQAWFKRYFTFNTGDMTAVKWDALELIFGDNSVIISYQYGYQVLDAKYNPDDLDLLENKAPYFPNKSDVSKEEFNNLFSKDDNENKADSNENSQPNPSEAASDTNN